MAPYPKKESIVSSDDDTASNPSSDDEPTLRSSPTVPSSPTKRSNMATDDGKDGNTLHNGEYRSSPTKTTSSLQEQHRRRDPLSTVTSPDLEYCEDLVVATAIYETATDDGSNEGYLPTCVEYDPDSKPFYRIVFYRRMICMVFVVIGVLIGTVIGAIKMTSSDDTDLKNENEWMRPEIESYLSTSTIDELSVTDEAYDMALKWMMMVDPLRNEFAASSSYTGDHLFQRFIMAYFYYATSKDAEWAYCAPPQINDKSTCSYQYSIRGKFQGAVTEQHIASRWLSDTPSCTWAGVACNESNEVESISLDSFKLTGVFPNGMLYLSSLKGLMIGDSNLKGPLPNDIVSRLPNLENMMLDQNQFTGTIPEQWFLDIKASSTTSPKLQKLILSNNQLSGTIPSDFNLFRNLTVLSLTTNQFHGTIPESIFAETIEYILISNNQLTGTISKVIGKCSKLEFLAVNDNQLNGTIPTEIGKLKTTHNIEVKGNMLTGPIPDEIYRLSDLFFLDVSENQLNGTIKSNIGRNFPMMEYLRLDSNQFSGTIPTQISTMRLLKEFTYENNLFTGTIPNELCHFASNEKCCTTYDCCTVNGEECSSSSGLNL